MFDRTVSRIVLFLFFVVSFFAYFHATNEDAWITFKYIKNLADGFGLVENPYDLTQEGYSTLSLVLLSTVLHKLFGIPIVFASKIVGFLAYASVIVVLIRIFELYKTVLLKPILDNKFIYNLFSYVIVLSIMFSSFYSYWVTQGLETILFSALNVFLYYLMLRLIVEGHSLRLHYAAIVTCFVLLNTRPEGLTAIGIYSVFLAIYCLYQKNQQTIRQQLGYVKEPYVLFAILISLFLLIKVIYFGDIASNPSYVKLSTKNFQPPFGIHYFVSYASAKGLLYSIVAFLAIVSLGVFGVIKIFSNQLNKFSLTVVATLGFVLANLIFIAHVRGDYMTNFRFFTPHLPFYVILSSIFIMCIRHVLVDKFGIKLFDKSYWLLLILPASSLWEHTSNPMNYWWESGFISPANYHTHYNTSYSRGVDMLNHLMEGKDGNYYALSEYGYVPFHTEHNGLDTMGLNQKQLAWNFKNLPLLEALDANSDFILSKLPVFISTVGQVYYDEQGALKADPGTAWWFNSYANSELFKTVYKPINVPNLSKGEARNDEFVFFERKTNVDLPNVISSTNLKDYSHWLMRGFEKETDDKFWASDTSRVLLNYNGTDKYVYLSGYIPDISFYPEQTFDLALFTNNRRTGDALLGESSISESGFFKLKFSVNSVVMNGGPTLIQIESDLFDNTKSNDNRRISFIFIEAGFTDE